MLQVVRPTRTTYIKFVNSLTGRIAQQIDLSTTHKDITYPQGILERNITTTITVPLLEKLYYYVTVDSGKMCIAIQFIIHHKTLWSDVDLLMKIRNYPVVRLRLNVFK